jgi:hypothetical protein
VSALLLVPLALAVGASTVRLALEPGDVPDDDDIAAAAAAARDGGDDGAIVLLPPWSMRPLPALGPAARRVTGSDGPADRLLVGRYASVTAIVEPDAAPWRAVLAPLGAPTRVQRHGAVVVERYAGLGPARFDLLDALPTAAITLDGAPCDEPAGRGAVVGVRCAGQPASLRVTREHALVTENGRLVVRVAPPLPGARLQLAFAAVPLGDTLVVAAGHTRAGVERPDGVVVVEVMVDDVSVATLRRRPTFVVEPSRAALRAAFVRPASPEGDGFRADVIDTRAWAGIHRLAFVVRSEDGARVDQDFALDAFVPGAAAEPR